MFFVAVEEEVGWDSESCGGRFSALSGQQLSSICSLLAATTLVVIVPDRDEKKEGGGG